jgi:hypothetical protein
MTSVDGSGVFGGATGGTSGLTGFVVGGEGTMRGSCGGAIAHAVAVSAERRIRLSTHCMRIGSPADGAATREETAALTHPHDNRFFWGINESFA